MEKQRKYKVFSIVALMFVIVSLSLGYASFSKVLTIESKAIVLPSNFAIVVSDSFNTPEEGKVQYFIAPKNIFGFTAEEEVIYRANDKHNITADSSKDNILLDINVDFSRPGQSIEYEMYIHNMGEYTTYLKSITLNNINTNLNKTCIPGDGVDPVKVEAACNGINLSLYLSTNGVYQLVTTNMSFSNEIDLFPGGYGRGKAVISYDENATRVDGPFSVKFGSIEVEYSTNPA